MSRTLLGRSVEFLEFTVRNYVQVLIVYSPVWERLLHSGEVDVDDVTDLKRPPSVLAAVLGLTSIKATLPSDTRYTIHFFSFRSFSHLMT